jgi:ethanolamine utilization protein EutN
MFLARITGSVVSTSKVETMVGQKLLVVEPLRVNEKDQSGLIGTGRTFIAVDTVGAGEGEVVLIVQGSSARFTPQTKPLPVDCAIIGIVDTVHLGTAAVFDSKQDQAKGSGK